MKVDLIEAGKFFADGGAMFGAIPKTAWSRRYPADENNGCILTMRCALVRTDDGHVVLIDNGAGTKQLKALSYYRFFDLKDIGEELQRLGMSCEEVTDVVLTHLHFDHCGYTVRKDPDTGDLSLAFPNATCWVSRRQWETLLHPHPLEADSYFLENMSAVQRADKVKLVEQPLQLCDGISLRLYDGHTEGQIVPYIQTDEQVLVFAGDVIPLAASVSPEWISAYDISPLTSYDAKMKMLKEAAEQHQRLIFCHDAYTESANIKQLNHFFKAIEGQRVAFL